jgi:hypothetical protein
MTAKNLETLDKRRRLHEMLHDAYGDPLEKASAYIQLVPSIKSVIPGRLRSQPFVVFQVGHDMAVPIPDLTLDDVGLKATLSFGGRPFHCTVPWEDIVGLSCPERRISHNWTALSRPEGGKVRSRGHLRLIQGGRR